MKLITPFHYFLAENQNDGRAFFQPPISKTRMERWESTLCNLTYLTFLNGHIWLDGQIWLECYQLNSGMKALFIPAVNEVPGS